MRVIVILLLGVAAASAFPKQNQRIVGGTTTTINQYPQIVSLLYAYTINTGFWHKCGGTILNNRSYLTAAHCTIGEPASLFRARVGSTNLNAGGTVIFSQQIINHPSFNWATADSDIAIVRTLTEIHFNNVVQPASIAGLHYHLADNQPVWAAGWGAQFTGGPLSPQLRHVQIYSINQEVCRQRYATVNDVITDNMLCSGVLDVGGRDQCQGDSGGPLFHNGVLVGVCSWGRQCASSFLPGVNVRVTMFTTWIAQNA